MELLLVLSTAIIGITVLVYEAIGVFKADALAHHPCKSHDVRRTYHYPHTHPYGGRATHGYPTRDRGVW